MKVKPEVDLIGYTDQPLDKLYMAYRVCYSSDTPQETVDKIATSEIADNQIKEFIVKRLETGHTSPLEQIWFEFVISGVSRSFSHQFVRHRTGISFEQQSQRYVKFDNGFDYVLPKSIEQNAEAEEEFQRVIGLIEEGYRGLREIGIEAEDARALLPNATATNFKVTVNFAELLHIADLRLCTQAQQEFRRVVALMRAEIKKVSPFLAGYLQPKCGVNRLGYCDESKKAYDGCSLSAVRPHKENLFDAKGSFRQIQEPDLAYTLRD